MGDPFTGLNQTDDIVFYAEFKAEVIDKPSGSVVAQRDGYWVKHEGKYKRSLTHGGFSYDCPGSPNCAPLPIK